MRLLLLSAASLLLMVPGFWHFYPPYPSDNERFGVGLAGDADSLIWYDVAQLNAGWYTCQIKRKCYRTVMVLSRENVTGACPLLS